MSTAEKPLAVHRLSLLDDVFRKMQTPRFPPLTPAELTTVTPVLSS